ncbi:apolipoprotein D-like [Belonocnema kinseyi]|uniref:apolipoprotein D-like n=1 Tax=Belonocnema kinseyi TaxID=2817044 RepID=UPI00143E011A|nr:apolipoprotein D-like [Belonocnema kinseyi]XP_033226091.1 apolipoprotein D-like [Belonocnema kinseyi]
MIQVGILLLTCTGALAQVPGFGSCPKVDVVQNFDVSKYLGVWYEVQKYFAVFEFGGKCITANYTQKSDGSVNVLNRQINVLTGKPSTIEGSAKLAGSTNEGKLSVVFPSVPGQIPAPYWILDTDYENYAVVFSCTDVTLFHAKIIWILTRKQDPSKEVLEKAYSVLDKNQLSRSPLMKTIQKNCTSAH